MLLALFGAALLYGDGVITPAISVLSAVEGLERGHPGRRTAGGAHHLRHPRRCSSWSSGGAPRGIGGIFGPVMLVWFLFIAVAGLVQVVAAPAGAGGGQSRRTRCASSQHNGFRGFEVLGSAVLAITGGEALYADMGHFGRRPIRLSWYVVVFPALLLNYCGQGALLLLDSAARANPFYALVPRSLLVPSVVLATVATIIASQALISGAFSLTRQAVQLGYVPAAQRRPHQPARTRGRSTSRR